jgi:hypothetical protein
MSICRYDQYFFFGCCSTIHGPVYLGSWTWNRLIEADLEEYGYLAAPGCRAVLGPDFSDLPNAHLVGSSMCDVRTPACMPPPEGKRWHVRRIGYAPTSLPFLSGVEVSTVTVEASDGG